MSSLLDLPQELWQIILLHLDHSSVKALNRACSAAYHHTLPALYHTIKPFREFADDADALHWLSQVIDVLLRRPQIRDYVRSIDLLLSGPGVAYTTSRSWKLAPRWGVFVSSNHAVATEYLRTRSDLFPDLPGISNGIKGGNPEAWTALVLSMLPRLQALSLAGCFMDFEARFLTSLVVASGRQWRTQGDSSLFSMLEEFHLIEPLPEAFWPCWQAIQALFYLPKIGSLSLLLPSPWTWNWPGDIIPHSPIKKLRLSHSTIMPQQLVHILKACPGLEEFSFEAAVLTNLPYDPHDVVPGKHSAWTEMYGTDNNRHPSWNTGPGSHPCKIDLDQVAAILQPFRSTLKSFAFCARPVFISPTMPHSREWSALCRGNLFGLKQLEALEVLDIPTELLTLVPNAGRGYGRFSQFVPSSLRKLYVGFWSEEEIDATMEVDDLVELVAEYIEHSPGTQKIKEIAIVDDGLGAMSQDGIALIVALCRRNSIICSLHSDFGPGMPDRELATPWTANWRPSLVGLEMLERSWQTCIKMCRHEGRGMPHWLVAYADTVASASYDSIDIDGLKWSDLRTFFDAVPWTPEGGTGLEHGSQSEDQDDWTTDEYLTADHQNDFSEFFNTVADWSSGAEINDDV